MRPHHLARSGITASGDLSTAARNTRPLPTIIVPCPTCGAGVGARCIGSGHVARRRMALRAERAL